MIQNPFLSQGLFFSPTTRGYKFTYDGLNRLLDAVYGEGTNIGSNANRFSEKVGSYDKNGNILSLQRYGQTSVNGYGLVDDLSYTLDGNHLQRVDDVVTGSAYNGSLEFKDAVKQANEYAYDAAGNLTQDLNKNISNIQYNCLNLPRRITFTDGSSIEYTYASDGTKLRTKHIINGTTTTTDYCGNVIYENSIQQLLLTEEGYVTLGDKKYHYYLRDHQGNNRVVVDASGIVEEVNHYYPFGSVFASISSVQPYKYNGKELDTKKDLTWYDYGARHYDAAVGRFHTQDRFAEKYYPWSPYTYCYDSPVLHVDPTGKFGETVWDVFNVGLGLKSFVDNLKSGHIGAALMDGAGVVLDTGSALLPFVPGGASSAIQALRGADKVADAVQAMNRGRRNEIKVLESICEVKNTKAMTTTLKNTNETVTVIPDAVTDTKIIEIKDTKAVYNTKQIRGEQQIAQRESKKFEIITGEKTHISKNVKADEIIRRKDIGPQ